jgi:hypothetical protein
MQSDADWILMVDSDISYGGGRHPGVSTSPIRHNHRLALLQEVSQMGAGCRNSSVKSRIRPRRYSRNHVDANFSIPASGILRPNEYGLADVEWIGTGAMLASREALMKIVEFNPTDKTEANKKVVHQFFKYESFEGKMGASDVTMYYGEDVSFCRLARRAGVSVKAKIDARTGHAGFIDYRFDAAAVNRLKNIPAPKQED